MRINCSTLSAALENPDIMKVVVSIVATARNMGLEIAAVGVRTKEQLDFLTSIMCDMVQGDLFGLPRNAEEFEEDLKCGFAVIDESREAA